MAKGNNKKGKHQTQSAQASPIRTGAAAASGATAVATPAAPTDDQLVELGVLELQVEELTGTPTAPADPKPEVSLDQALRRASGLLDEVEKLRAKAREAVGDAATRLSELEAQKREQDANYKKKLKEAEELRASVESDARALAEDKAKAKEDRARRAGELDARERGLLEKEALLAERAANAEAGFLDERRKILAGLDEQLAALRDERSRVLEEIATRRADAERERAEIEAQRAEAMRKEDAARVTAADEARRALTEELHLERASRLADAAVEVARVRAEGLEQLKKDRAEHEAAVTAERAALDEERRGIRADRNAIRREREQLETERELLDEDRRALQAKVERHAAAQLAELRGQVSELTERLNVALAACERFQGSLVAHEEVRRRLGDRRPEELLEQLALLEQKNAELQADLSRRLGNAAEQRLAALEKAEADWREEQVVLRHKLAEAEQRIGLLRISATELDTLRKQREALETNKKLLEAALQELQAEVDKYTKADDKRNPMEALIAIDRDERLHPAFDVRTWNPIGGPTPTLKAFADDLRHRIATGVDKRQLFYSERDVRCFLGGIAMSRLLLLQGISGTGKTSLPLAFAGAIGASPIGSRPSEEERRATEAVEVVEVQAGWRDRQDLIGYFNAFHRHYYATNFLQALYRAGTPAFRDRPFFIILDEINLSRVEQFFADFLSALEQPQSKQRLTLLNDPVPDPARLMVEGRHLPIPPNVWFIGTANHDETTTEFADKTYDRAHVMELPRRDPKHDSFVIRKTSAREPISFKDLCAAFDEAIARQKSTVDHVHAWLRSETGIAGVLERRFRIGWGNRLEEQARRFVPVVVEAGGTVGEAMDHLLQTRVLRKLRDRHDVRHRALDEFRTAFDKTWDDLDKGNRPVRSLALLERELRAKKDEEV